MTWKHTTSCIYIALKDAITTFISIHPASGKYEYSRSDLSKLVNDVIDYNPHESRKDDKLMTHLQRDFGPELHLGKWEKVEEHRVKWTTFNNLKTWAGSIKDIIIDLGFDHLSTPEENVQGKVYFYEW